jgi:phosphoglycolate phosphatase
MAAIRNVVFDLDGTLIDSLPGIAYSVDVALDECGVLAIRKDLRSLIGPPIRNILATVSGISNDATLDVLLAAFRRSYDTEGWRQTVLQGSAKSMLGELRNAGVRLWVVTNKPALSTNLILDELGVAPCFGEVVCRDSRTPPFDSKTEMLGDLLHRHEITTNDCLMVGDTMEDCRAAAEVGVACVIVPHGYAGRLDEKLPAGCVHIESWPDLVARATR